MGVTLTNGKVSIGGIYALKIDRDNYENENLSQSFSIQYDVADGVDTTAAIAEAEAIYDGLINTVKLAVCAHLGVDVETDDKGVLQPKLGEFAGKYQQVAGPQAAPAGSALPNPYAGGGGQQQYTPKADLSGAPRFVADLGDGSGAIQWIDLRGVKAAHLFAPNAADFRDANNSKHQVWLKDKGGNVKQSVAAGLQAAGLQV
jgi:hypothetical protein